MPETELKIRFFPDPVLRRKARPVQEVSVRERMILSQMSRLMYDGDGIGLAAPQAGISEAMIVADCGSGLYKLANPRIVEKEGTQFQEEGCLSFPGICIKVKRAKKILVKALDEYANPQEISAEGLFACVLQHEIDHLNGKTIIDYASFLERFRIASRLKGLKKRFKDEKMPESGAKSCPVRL